MEEMVTFKPEEVTQAELHDLLVSSIAPRPICLISTVDQDGNVNLSPYSFFNVFSSDPPVLVFSPTLKIKDASRKDTHENVIAVKEAAVSMVNFKIVEQMSMSSANYAKGVNEFVKTGLTEAPSKLIQPPMVKESPVSFECKVLDIIELGNKAGSGNLVICEVLMIHANKAYMDEEDKLNPKIMDLVARMGESWYTRIMEDTLFELEEPHIEKGMGVDKLPRNAKLSTILNGNELARLGNQKKSAGEKFLKNIENDGEVQSIISWYTDDRDGLIRAMHLRAQSYLERGRSEEALALLMHLEERLN